jgi:lipopolysaccharide export system permease protein
VLLEIVADRGEMYVTDDERYFVMNLYDGWQYQELQESGGRDSDGAYPFIRTHFKEWSKVFDLSEFELARTDEELFKSHQTMLNIGQLTTAIDSIDLVIRDRIENLQRTSQKYFTPLEEAAKLEKDSLQEHKQEEKEDKPSTSGRRRGQNPLLQKNLDQLDSLGSIALTFPKYKRPELFNRAKTYARSMNSQSGSAARSIKSKLESRVNHVFELHNKFSMAVACILFLFIGAPMGAIVRKGGFGYPLLIAILFFMFYMILTIFSKNIAERFVIDAMLAAWLPCLILFPVSMVLTYQAMNDYKNILFFDLLAGFISFIAGLFRGKKSEPTPQI